MAITQDDKIRSTPRSAKDPNSYEYARQMVYVLKTVWGRVSFDLNHWDKELEEAKRNKIWVRHKPAYGSLEELLAKEVGFSDAEYEVKKELFERSEKEKEKQQGKRNDLLGGNATKLGGKNTAQHVLRRLARDHTQLFEAAKRGELSVNAAAIQAGIRKKPTPEQICVREFKKCDSRLGTLKVIVESLEPHERAVVMDWLKESLT